MPEYLAPGVYVEETSFRSKSLEGVSTSTAGFLGPACYGPTEGVVFITSFAEFERNFGGLDQLTFNGTPTDNYFAHGVRAFFEEGGKRLYITRVYKKPKIGDGRATSESEASPPDILLTARFPGRCGNMRITFSAQISDNLLVTDPLTGKTVIRGIVEHDCVLVSEKEQSPAMVSPTMPGLYDVVRHEEEFVLRNGIDEEELWVNDGTHSPSDALDPNQHDVRLLTVNVAVERPVFRPKRPLRQYTDPEVVGNFSFHPKHSNSLTSYFIDKPASRRLFLSVPFFMEVNQSIYAGSKETSYEIATSLLGQNVIDALTKANASTADLQISYRLIHGSDGLRPTPFEYAGEKDDNVKSGLAAFEDIEDISILAAPGYSHSYLGNETDVESIQAYLINHCHKMRYRIAVLDAPDEQVLSEIRAYRSKLDSTHAAIYYPWITVYDPITEAEANMPPSGFMAGIYARTDIDHGVHKAPANEVVRMAVGFETVLNKAQQDILNPAGINCFRFFPGRGNRIWGARTISSDPEWKYVNVRRYFAYLERTIDRGTQWVVFENNGPVLWANVQRTVEDFMYNEWKSGRLLGEKPETAYFVRCDRSTMTQNDLDNGRLVCLIGVSVLKPAEFVIFRIGQWTADSNA